MIGSASRNVGKTELACDLIRRYRKTEEIIGIKIVTVSENGGACPRGKKGCEVCSSFSGNYMITQEVCGPAEKDTVRMLNAGADRVFWLRVREAHLEQGILALLRLLNSQACIICESNSARMVLEPGLFLVLRKMNSTRIKKSCRLVMNHADRVIRSSGLGWDVSPTDFTFRNGVWRCRKPFDYLGMERHLGSVPALDI